MQGLQKETIKTKDMKHSCEMIYNIGANGKIYGTEKGVCRITGKESTGVNFDKWVKDTFNDHAYLYPGSIISNEAAFCFDEASDIIKEKTGKEKAQRFRTYSHIVADGNWYCLTKADKQKIYELIVSGAELVCLTDTGQKHILFKHKAGMWQLDDIFIFPDIELLKYLHTLMCDLMRSGFSQTEIITGNYISSRVFKAEMEEWREKENGIKKYRGTAMMAFAGWMLFIDEESKQKIQDSYKKREKSETEKKDITNQLEIW